MSIKENDFTLKKHKADDISQKLREKDYTNDQIHLPKLNLCLKAARGIGPYVNADKTKFIRFK